MTGTIRANGGAAGSGRGSGGHGSGGAIRLMSNLINGNGSMTATSPVVASNGRIRLEAYQQSYTGSVNPIAILSSPSLLASALPSGPPPSLRAVDVDGVTLPINPTGDFSVTPDATINNGAPVTINIAASNIPVGTIVTLRISSEGGPDITTTTTALTGTFASSTASASVTFPSGFSRGYLRATW